ncbi:MAG: hypothetical protein ACLVJ6_16040 [Merdibacter sp.]
MRRSAFGHRRIFDKLMLLDAVMDGIDREYAFTGRRLIKDDGLGLTAFPDS